MAKINPDILKWARETAGYSIEEAAKMLGLSDSKERTAAEKLQAMENGSVEPKREILSEMARRYNRQLLVFYMEDVPEKNKELTDFRQQNLQVSPVERGLGDALVRDIQVRQQIIKNSISEDENIHELSFVNSLKLTDEISIAANKIIEILNFNLTKFRKFRKVEDSFHYLRDLAESAGVFVIMVGDLGHYTRNIPIEVFRGFCIADRIAPFIVINSNDSKRAYSFTLLHEITHIFLGHSGISDLDEKNQTEKFCNDTAAEILFPKAEIS